MLRVRPINKKLLFLFSVYLLFAVTVVAFDPHGALPSKTCTICFMGISLASAVGQADVTCDVYFDRQYVQMADEICRLYPSVPLSAISYRGPPASSVVL